jgi:hypothetical protein
MTTQQWETAPAPVGASVTVRQIVAYNLGRARRERGLTQEQLGEHMFRVTGNPWSRATVSAAEGGWNSFPGRVRHFDLNEVVAFAFILKVPVCWFLLPPDRLPDDRPVQADQPWITVGDEGDPPDEALTSDFLRWVALAVADERDGQDLIALRVRAEAPELAGARLDIAKVRSLHRSLGAWLDAHDMSRSK